MSLERLKKINEEFNTGHTFDVLKSFPALYLELFKNLKDVRAESFWVKIAEIAIREMKMFHGRNPEELAGELYQAKFGEEPNWDVHESTDKICSKCKKESDDCECKDEDFGKPYGVTDQEKIKSVYRNAMTLTRPELEHLVKRLNDYIKDGIKYTTEDFEEVEEDFNGTVNDIGELPKLPFGTVDPRGGSTNYTKDDYKKIQKLRAKIKRKPLDPKKAAELEKKHFGKPNTEMK